MERTYPLEPKRTFISYPFRASQPVATMTAKESKSARTMDRGGVAVAVGLASISVVLAAVVFAAETASTGPMQFIEPHLGFSPDGGDGSMELLVVVVLVAIITVLGVRLATK